jgi:hypothetical protein
MAKHTVPDIVDEGGCESHVCLVLFVLPARSADVSFDQPH